MTSHSLKVLTLLLAVAMAASSVRADGTLQNHLGTARLRTTAAAPSVDMADFLSVYRFDTPLFGAYDVALFEGRTPLTAANFRGYADRGDYTDSFIHRSISAASSGLGVVQGGGFSLTGFVPSVAAVVNEPGLSNTVGTIAVAKQGGDPDSGTNQWFFNTADNSVALDTPANNGGFTVFGEVLYDGMDIVGLDGQPGGIAGLTVWNGSSIYSAFTHLPLSDDYDGSRPVGDDDFVTFSSISQVTGQTYQVLGSSDPSLVTGAFTGSSLSLDVADGATGSADLTIRTTDGAGQWFDSVLQVAVSLPGDFDDDGDVDTDDVDLILANMTGPGGQSAAPLLYDFDGDGDVDADDVTFVFENLVERSDGGVGTSPSDFNLDGVVGTDDFALLDGGFGAAGGWPNGDVTFDDVIDGTDLAAFAAAFGPIGGGGVGEAPEPATLSLLIVASVGLLRRRR